MKAMLPSGIEADVIPCGIDLERFENRPMLQARHDLGLPNKERLVLFVGNPKNPIKRYELAESAVARLDTGLNARLITLHGQPHSQVPVFMDACDALLITSHHEGSPTSVKEALASGLPVVSVPVGDVAERVHGVPECRVSCNDDPEEIARELEQVLRCPARANTGREAVKDLDHRVITERLLSVYRQVASDMVS